MNLNLDCNLLVANKFSWQGAEQKKITNCPGFLFKKTIEKSKINKRNWRKEEKEREREKRKLVGGVFVLTCNTRRVRHYHLPFHPTTCYCGLYLFAHAWYHMLKWNATNKQTKNRKIKKEKDDEFWLILILKNNAMSTRIGKMATIMRLKCWWWCLFDCFEKRKKDHDIPNKQIEKEEERICLCFVWPMLIVMETPGLQQWPWSERWLSWK